MTHQVGRSLPSAQRSAETDCVPNIDVVWPRIVQYAGDTFTTATGLEFTYRVPGQYLRVTRDGREINRSLSRTNFGRALDAMPADRPATSRTDKAPPTPGQSSWILVCEAQTGSRPANPRRPSVGVLGIGRGRTRDARRDLARSERQNRGGGPGKDGALVKLERAL